MTNSRFLEFDAISAGGGVLLHLEVVQTHPEFAQDFVPHVLQLPQHFLLQLLVPFFDPLRQLPAFARILRERRFQLQNLVIVYASIKPRMPYLPSNRPVSRLRDTLANDAHRLSNSSRSSRWTEYSSQLLLHIASTH